MHVIMRVSRVAMVRPGVRRLSRVVGVDSRGRPHSYRASDRDATENRAESERDEYESGSVTVWPRCAIGRRLFALGLIFAIVVNHGVLLSQQSQSDS